METLGKIFGSQARIKIMRLFLLNKDQSFNNKEIIKRSRVNSSVLRKELKLLSSVKFAKKKGKNWIFNPSFKYTLEFDKLLTNSDTVNKEAILNSFKKAGRIKLLIVSGIFIKNKESRVDILVVGDKLKRGKIEEEIRKLEAEIGAELVYAIFNTDEFSYRFDMYDKLVRDILDFPHEVVFRAKELSTQTLKKT